VTIITQIGVFLTPDACFFRIDCEIPS